MAAWGEGYQGAGPWWDYGFLGFFVIRAISAAETTVSAED